MHLMIDRRPSRGASPTRLPRAAAAALLTLLIAAGLPVPQALAVGTATMSGIVTAPDGHSLPAGTSVTVRVDGQPDAVTPVDVNGAYSVTVPADTTFSLTAGPTATASLADSAFYGARLSAGQSGQHHPLLRLATSTGTVVAPDGTPVAGALVAQRASVGYERTSSKADGTWATAGPDGTYETDAQPPAGSDLRSAPFQSLVVPGKGAVLMLRPPANVLGSVSLPDGSPANGGFVQTVDTRTGQHLHDPDARSSVGSDGTFGLLLPAGSYRVTAQPPYDSTDLVPTSADVVVAPESATTTVGIALEKGNVLGTVQRPDGTTYTGGGHVDVRDANGQLLPVSSVKNGTFAAKLAPGQTATLVARPFGDSTVVASAPLTVTGPADGDPAMKPTLALQAPNITGVVRGLDGAAVAYTGVQVLTATGMHVDHTSTDGSGRYALRLPVGDHVLRAQPHFDAPAEVVAGSQAVTVGEALLEQDLELRRANVLGRVLDPSGTAVSGAPVQVTDADGVHVDAFASSRSDGSYGLLLAPGTWTVTARAPHGDTNAWVAGSRSVTIADVQVSGLDISLQRPNVVGFVRDPSGAAVANASVNVQDSQGYHVPDAHAFTGSTGKFGFLLPAGDYLLQAQPPYGVTHLASGTASVTAGATEVSVDVTLRQPNVGGEVRDTSGALLSNSYVEVFDTTRSTYLQGANAAQGRYALFLQPGTYRLTARPPYGSSGMVATSITVTVEKDVQALGHHITLSQPNLTGVVSGRDGVAVAGSVVDVTDSQGQYIPGAYSVTGSDGRYALLLPSGTYSITARPAWNDQLGHVPTTVREVVVAADAAAVQDIQLGTPNVTGIVTTPDGQPHRDAWIDVQDANGQHVQGVYAFTNSEGEFALALPAGVEHQLTARPSWNSSGLVAGTAKTTVPEGGSASVSIALRTPNVTGQVTAPDGTTVRGSFVDAVDKATGQHVRDGWGVTGADGTYALALPAGEYRITARPAWNSASSTVPASVDVVVTDGATTEAPVQLGAANVVGTVTGDGVGLPNLLVRATNSTGDVAHAWTNSSGAYALGLPAGDYTLVVEPPYDNSAGFVRTSQPITVGSSPTTHDVALSKGSTTGVVLDSTRAPVPNAFVHVYDANGDLHADLGVATGADGTFALALATSSTWSLQAQPSYALNESHSSSAMTPVTAPAEGLELTLTSTTP